MVANSIYYSHLNNHTKRMLQNPIDDLQVSLVIKKRVIYSRKQPLHFLQELLSRIYHSLFLFLWSV